MCHHRLDPLKSHVGSDVRVGQHAGGIENVEALVLHCAHVEIIHGNDVVEIEVVLEAIDGLIPAHRLLQRLHRVIAIAQIFLFDPNQ